MFIYKIIMLGCRYMYLGLYNSEVEAARSPCDHELIDIEKKFYYMNLNPTKSWSLFSGSGLMTKQPSNVMEGKQ